MYFMKKSWREKSRGTLPLGTAILCRNFTKRTGSGSLTLLSAVSPARSLPKWRIAKRTVSGREHYLAKVSCLESN
jgi:hypothetical protein